MGKNNRFQLFLYHQHERTAASAEANGVSLSTEVRNRVARSFWQDDVIAEITRLNEEFDEEILKHLVDFIKAAQAKHFIPREDGRT